MMGRMVAERVQVELEGEMQRAFWLIRDTYQEVSTEAHALGRRR
jgi:hypothetical protein